MNPKGSSMAAAVHGSTHPRSLLGAIPAPIPCWHCAVLSKQGFCSCTCARHSNPTKPPARSPSHTHRTPGAGQGAGQGAGWGAALPASSAPVLSTHTAAAPSLSTGKAAEGGGEVRGQCNIYSDVTFHFYGVRKLRQSRKRAERNSPTWEAAGAVSTVALESGDRSVQQSAGPPKCAWGCSTTPDMES